MREVPKRRRIHFAVALICTGGLVSVVEAAAGDIYILGTLGPAGAGGLSDGVRPFILDASALTVPEPGALSLIVGGFTCSRID